MNITQLGGGVEVPAIVGSEGAIPLPTRPLPDELLGLVQHVKAYERLSVSAARSGDRRGALLALMSNPLVGDYATAEAILTAILDAHQSHLPIFHP